MRDDESIATLAKLTATDIGTMRADIEYLSNRVTRLEAEILAIRGTLARLPDAEEPTKYLHDVKPNAPR